MTHIFKLLFLFILIKNKMIKYPKENISRSTRKVCDVIEKTKQLLIYHAHLGGVKNCPQSSSFDASINYTNDSHVSIGDTSTICQYCQAKKWPLEVPGFCCGGGKFLLDGIADPLEPLKSLINGTHNHSKVFLDNLQKSNPAFQMKSFDGKEIRNGYLH
jgi:calcineurin-like phosphoesterase family protein